MEEIRNKILNKTHNGLNIYAYVLRQYYPDATVLTLSGRNCRLTRNPFNCDKETLSIYVINSFAVHKDLELENFEGDVFDFAKLHFKTKTETELVNKLNDVMHLRLFKETEPKEHWEDIPDDTWYALCSFYKAPIRNVFPYKTLKLHEIHSLIKSNTYKGITTQLRAISDIKEKRKFKANNFDYVTFSGEFERRNDNNLKKHSSLITIDFDHLPNINEVKKQLLEDDYFETELLFTSPSGDGLKWIIKIDLSKATHQEFFKAVANYLKQTYHLEVDQSGKDISRACFLSHDPDAILHKKHKSYE
jgi:hypothetical protein